MSPAAHITNSGERPRLVDFLLIAEDQQIDVGLRVWVGAVDVGLVGIASGTVVFAEIPGTAGDPALKLLAILSGARFVPEAWTTRVTNVESSWRTLVDERELLASADRAQRLAAARDELQRRAGSVREHSARASEASSEDSGVFGCDEPDESTRRALRLGLELLDWGAISAYLRGDLDRARRLLERREQLQPGDLICQANLQRLRMRILDQEVEARGKDVPA